MRVARVLINAVRIEPITTPRIATKTSCESSVCLLVAGLPAGDAVKVAVGGFADRHALGGKGSADVAEIAFVLRGSIFLGSQS